MLGAHASRFYLYVLAGIVAGVLIGCFAPAVGVALQPLGDGFIDLIKMLITPLIFLSVALGICGASDMTKAGRVGVKSIVYFEVLSTAALAIGLVIVTALRPGSGFNVDPRTLDAGSVAMYVRTAHEHGVVSFMLGIIPTTFADAFTAHGSVLQVLLLAILFGCSLAGVGQAARPLVGVCESLLQLMFRMIGIVLWLAPLGAGGAMAFTIGKYGVQSLGPMMRLMGTFYLACVLFVVVVLGLVARLAGFSVLRFVRYIREELLLVLGTSSSESALAPLMEKLQRLGCSREVVGLVVPSGYSFNLDGTNIYMTLAVVFIAQALNVHLTLAQELTFLAVAMLTSKGAAGVTGAGFVTLAATLSVLPSVPVAGLALILGIDRFMSEARALTNMVGNGVGAIVVSAWERDLDRDRLRRELATGHSASATGVALRPMPRGEENQ
jgi:aerobic C4-dicarboxylate transport protein